MISELLKHHWFGVFEEAVLSSALDLIAQYSSFSTKRSRGPSKGTGYLNGHKEKPEVEGDWLQPSCGKSERKPLTKIHVCSSTVLAVQQEKRKI